MDRPAKRKLLGFRLFRQNKQVRIGIAPKAVLRLRDKLRGLTRRTRSGLLAEVLEQVNRQVQGWVSYFRLADTPTPFKELDEWLRRRLRQLVWKRWKRGTTRWRELVALGVPATMAGLGAVEHGPWRMAASPVVNMALSNTYWKRQGLHSLLETYHRLQMGNHHATG